MVPEIVAQLGCFSQKTRALSLLDLTFLEYEK